MARPEYMIVPLKIIPDEMIKEYNPLPLARNNMVLAQINYGMYGLPQAGRIAYNKLVLHLTKGGYVPTCRTLSLFNHITRPLHFCLVVDNFGVKYTNRQNTKNLVEHLSKEYKWTTGWEGKIYLGIKLDWDYDKRTVDLSMPNYIPKAR